MDHERLTGIIDCRIEDPGDLRSLARAVPARAITDSRGDADLGLVPGPGRRDDDDRRIGVRVGIALAESHSGHDQNSTVPSRLRQVLVIAVPPLTEIWLS